jgi:uncharacterized protein
MIIPYEMLSPETLQRVVEEFVSREGTDYGPLEYSFDEKVLGVLNQVKRGSAVVVFDPETETCSIADPRNLRATE